MFYHGPPASSAAGPASQLVGGRHSLLASLSLPTLQASSTRTSPSTTAWQPSRCPAGLACLSSHTGSSILCLSNCSLHLPPGTAPFSPEAIPPRLLARCHMALRGRPNSIDGDAKQHCASPYFIACSAWRPELWWGPAAGAGGDGDAPAITKCAPPSCPPVRLRSLLAAHPHVAAFAGTTAARGRCCRLPVLICSACGAASTASVTCPGADTALTCWGVWISARHVARLLDQVTHRGGGLHVLFLGAAGLHECDSCRARVPPAWSTRKGCCCLSLLTAHKISPLLRRSAGLAQRGGAALVGAHAVARVPGGRGALAGRLPRLARGGSGTWGRELTALFVYRISAARASGQCRRGQPAKPAP